MYIIPATCSATPLPAPTPRRVFLISEITQATTRIAALAKKYPSWPASRVRATVARELNISTVQLRYMLTKAADS
jgi:hypothetical protein